MEAVGKLAGGVAHDFNNLLTVINGQTDLSMRRLDQDDPIHRRLEAIKGAGEQAASLTRQLLAFSRKQVLQPKVLDLNKVIFETNKILQRLIGEDIDLLVGLGPELGKVKADPSQIEQVLMNLSVNARDAMPQGGKLTIETNNVFIDEEYASHHFSVRPGRYVVLAVSDTGCGMDEATQSHIFDPFFTTKEVGKGTGLGLSTVYGIIKQSGGNIWVYSEVGRGTTFKIYLPCVDSLIAEPKISAEVTNLQKGTETVLLVEDEERVRDMTKEILQESGYQVLEAKHGQDALLVADRHSGTIHLMLSDVVMPQMSGRELAERLAPLHKDMKVLYMSGYTDDAIVHHGVLDEGMSFIEKPFTPNALARKVRELLNSTVEV
jgi:two-component system, cell cycle sensor histidine kinase and response regulator CckA